MSIREVLANYFPTFWEQVTPERLLGLVVLVEKNTGSKATVYEFTPGFFQAYSEHYEDDDDLLVVNLVSIKKLMARFPLVAQIMGGVPLENLVGPKTGRFTISLEEASGIFFDPENVDFFVLITIDYDCDFW